MQRRTYLRKGELETALDLASSGVTLKVIIASLGFYEPFDFWFAMEKDPENSRKFEAARVRGLECEADDLRSVHERVTDSVSAMAVKIQSDNLRWLLSKRIPRVYGDHLQVTTNERPSLRRVLERFKEPSIALPAPLPSLGDLTGESGEPEDEITLEDML